MSAAHIALTLVVGLIGGVLAGMFGIGGGLIMVPAMTFLLNFDFKTATGTSLAALLLPFGILGVMEYYKANNVNVNAALLLVAGLFIGSVIGAKITLSLPDVTVKRLFGAFLLIMSIKYLLNK